MYLFPNIFQNFAQGGRSGSKGTQTRHTINLHNGLVICHGKGNEDWNCFAPHGAGHLMSHADARELIDLDEFRETMKDVYSTFAGMGTIDESPMAYKDPNVILKLIKDTVEVDFLSSLSST